MLSSTLLSTLLLAASSVQAAPFFSTSKIVKRAEDQTASSIDKHAHTNMTHVQIHESCDAGQAHFIQSGLDDMNLLAKHAFDRILKYGESDELYRKYFGNASSAAAAGFYAQLLYGNKPGVLFRCDNPDGNCNEVTEEGPWAGHHRGKNATEQTVICPPTYNRRMQLATLCWDGVEIGSIPPARWLATDFMHRLMHVPSIVYGHISHAADSLGGVFELASSNDSATVTNQNTFQFYALDAYAYDVVWPGKSCVTSNPPQEEESHYSAPAPSSTTSSPEIAPTATATAAVEEDDHAGHDHAAEEEEDDHAGHDHASEESATPTSSAAESCHTHGDGTVHCD
ncbi:Zps1p [Sporobolomyces salmoneus]|uniref:Zps1p n=1 Tax=Sporobolomyces salmoneus TaxID=183962 RepID=UPI00317FBB94